MTDEERTRIGSLISRYGQEDFMKAYLKVHPKQADRINAVIGQRGIAGAVAMLFKYLPGATQKPKLPGSAATSLSTPQGVGQAPTQSLGVGTSPRTPAGPGIGTTEQLSREVGRPSGITGLEAPRSQVGPTQEAPIPEAQAAPLSPEQAPGDIGPPAPTAEPVSSPAANVYDFFDSLLLMSKEAGVPLSVLMGMMKQESQFDPGAVSSAGAVGLIQLMPDTARDRGLSVTENNDERLEPMRNIQAGLSHMRWLKENYKPSNVESWLAAYNAGHRRLKNEAWKTMKEPRDYANKVSGYAREYEADVTALTADVIKLFQNIRGGR